MSANLLTYFVFMLVLDTLFLIWPIVMARWEMHKEWQQRSAQFESICGFVTLSV